MAWERGSPGEITMKTRSACRASLVATALLVVLTADASYGQSPQRDLMKQSDVVFACRVVQLGGTSVSGVPSSPSIIDVEVTAVLEKPPAVVMAVGDRIAVRVKDPSAFSVGAQVTFYAHGWILGKGVAVKEVGHTGAPATARGDADPAEARAEVERIRAELDDANLRARYEAADRVIVGRVLSVGSATLSSRGGPTRVSEHDANWQEAVLEVEEAMKGAEPGTQVVIRFPGSEDAAWFGVPKLSVGQEGTFMLQEDRISGADPPVTRGGEVGAFTAMQPSDVLPKADAERVRRLMREP
jgi:hypothetical protein